MPSSDQVHVPHNIYVLRIYPITQRDADFSLRTDSTTVQSTIDSIHNLQENYGSDTPSTDPCSFAVIERAPA